ncbi:MULTISPECIES: hypothetical protein [unclassified Inquilinus]|uniref:hypothetical protein n=1 Tax=unclassified Inquilinus TaxID=2645927 RepID=UPI003F9187A9
MRPVRATLLPVLAAALLSGTAMAQTTPRYAPWQPPQSDQTKALLDELSRMIDQAERDKAASPDFITDLKRLEQRYSSTASAAPPSTVPVPAVPPAAPVPAPAPAAAPAPAPAPSATASLAGTRVFSDDFSDGNYTANPAWTSLQGTWTVDSGGLHSDTRAPKGQTQGGVAAIALQQGLKNNFGLEFDLADLANQGQFEIRVYQGASKDSGFRLVYLPTSSPTFALYRAGRSGITQVAQTTNTAALRREDRTRLTWTRDAAGRMVVALDGKTIIEGSDNGFRDGWNGVMLVNFGGDFALRSIQGVN